MTTNWILEYWNEIQNGLTVPENVRKVYRKLVNDLEETEPFYFDERKADRAIKFIEQFCKQSKGKDGGKPIRLLLWQKAFISALFGFVDENDKRKYRELFLVVGRKNGKTTLASGIGNYLLFADGEPGAAIYSAATTREQAKLSWDEARKMIKKSPALSSRARCLIGEIVTDFNDGIFKPLASDSNTLDGLNPSGAIMDEVAAWQRGKELYDVIVDGESAREQPLNIMITTAGTVREDIYDLLYDQSIRIINSYEKVNEPHDERFLPLLYTLDKREEWTDESAWVKANPSIDLVKSRDNLRYKVEKAKSNPMLVKNLLCKDFCIRETSSESWLNFEDAQNEAKFDISQLKPRYGIGGVDLSSTTDLTAAKVIFQVPNDSHIYVLQMYWIPEDTVEWHVREDKIPYDVWVQQGLMRTCPGNKIHPTYVTQWFREVRDELDIYIPFIGYDSWSSTYFVEEMKAEFGQASMIPVHQGKKTLSAPMQSLGADLRSKRIIYNDNPIDLWCLLNTSYEEDKNGNIQPCKSSRSTKRIDGFAALLDAYVVLQEKKADYEQMI